jgi:hypothetical protein
MIVAFPMLTGLATRLLEGFEQAIVQRIFGPLNIFLEPNRFQD